MNLSKKKTVRFIHQNVLTPEDSPTAEYRHFDHHFFFISQKTSLTIAESSSPRKVSIPTSCPSNLSTSSGQTSGCSLTLIAASFCAFMACSLPSGYNIGVVNTPQKVLKAFCNESFAMSGHAVTSGQLELVWSTVVSIFLIGAMVGSSVSAWAAGSLGRKGSLAAASILSLVGGGFFLSAKIVNSVICLLMGRLLTGIHCGLSSSLVPMFLMEISPSKYRSTMGVLHTLGMTVGILIAQVLGQDSLLGVKLLWPFLLCGYCVSILIGFLALFSTPESPTYLMMTLDEEARAFRTLERAYGSEFIDEVYADFHTLKQEKKMSESDSGRRSSMSSIKSSLKNRSLLKNLFLVCILHVGQQLSGINAVFYYSTKMFENVGFNESVSQLGSIGVAGVNVLVSLISIPIIKNLRKKPLMIFSLTSAGIFLSLLALNSYLPVGRSMSGYLSILWVMCYVFSYGLGLGPIPYMIGSDLLDSSMRAFGMSLGCFFNWSFNFCVGISFPSLESLLHENVYFIFVASCVVVLVIVVIGLDSSLIQDSQEDDSNRVQGLKYPEKIINDYNLEENTNNNNISVISFQQSRC